MSFDGRVPAKKLRLSLLDAYAALARGTKEVVDELTAWEQALTAMFPGVKIYRLIEILYDEFEADNGERWFQDKTLIRKFEQWLQTQDPLDWARIADDETQAEKSEGPLRGPH